MLLLVVSLLALPLGGCWDALEINDRAIVSAIAFDREPDKTFRIWVSILEPVQFKGEARSLPIRVLDGHGRTIEDALLDVQDRYIPRLYMGHMQWIIISERLARSSVQEVLAWLNRSLDRRLSQSVVISPGPFEDIVRIASPQATRSMQVVRESLAPKIGGSTNLGPWLEDIAEAGRDPVGGSFRPKYEKGRLIPKDEYEFDGLVLFRQDRMVAKLRPDDSLPFLLLNGDLRGGASRQSVLNVDGVQRATVTWIASPSKRRALLVGNEVRYEVTLDVRGRLAELRGTLKPYDQKDISRVADLLTEAISAEMEAVFKKLQAAKVDSVGVGQLVHAKYPGYWRKVREDWREAGLPKVKLVVNANINLDIQGLSKKLTQPAPKGMEKFGAKPQQ